jgi:hypothetical protein
MQQKRETYCLDKVAEDGAILAARQTTVRAVDARIIIVSELWIGNECRGVEKD